MRGLPRCLYSSMLRVFVMMHASSKTTLPPIYDVKMSGKKQGINWWDASIHSTALQIEGLDLQKSVNRGEDGDSTYRPQNQKNRKPVGTPCAFLNGTARARLQALASWRRGGFVGAVLPRLCRRTGFPCAALWYR